MVDRQRTRTRYSSRRQVEALLHEGRLQAAGSPAACARIPERMPGRLALRPRRGARINRLGTPNFLLNHRRSLHFSSPPLLPTGVRCGRQCRLGRASGAVVLLPHPYLPFPNTYAATPTHTSLRVAAWGVEGFALNGLLFYRFPVLRRAPVSSHHPQPITLNLGQTGGGLGGWVRVQG